MPPMSSGSSEPWLSFRDDLWLGSRNSSKQKTRSGFLSGPPETYRSLASIAVLQPLLLHISWSEETSQSSPLRHRIAIKELDE